MDALGWDSLRRHPRHRRRLRRSSELRHGARRPAAGGAGLPRRHHRPARLATAPTRSRRWASRTCSSASPPATWIRWSTATRPTARSAHDDAYTPDGEGGKRPDRARDRLRAALPRGVPRRADRDRRHRGSLRRIAHYDYWSRQGAPLGAGRRQGRPAALRQCRARDRRDRAPARRRRDVKPIRDLRGTAFIAPASLPDVDGDRLDAHRCAGPRRCRSRIRTRWKPSDRRRRARRERSRTQPIAHRSVSASRRARRR